MQPCPPRSVSNATQLESAPLLAPCTATAILHLTFAFRLQLFLHGNHKNITITKIWRVVIQISECSMGSVAALPAVKRSSKPGSLDSSQRSLLPEILQITNTLLFTLNSARKYVLLFCCQVNRLIPLGVKLSMSCSAGQSSMLCHTLGRLRQAMTANPN